MDIEDPCDQSRVHMPTCLLPHLFALLLLFLQESQYKSWDNPWQLVWVGSTSLSTTSFFKLSI
jgi:hypothetical protein